MRVLGRIGGNSCGSRARPKQRSHSQEFAFIEFVHELITFRN
jgi:hypothetical protein